MAANAPAAAPQDTALQLRVRVELRIHPKTEAFAKNLKLNVLHGIVTLDGQVPTAFDSRTAERVAAGVSGVAGVVNRLVIAG